MTAFDQAKPLWTLPNETLFYRPHGVSCPRGKERVGTCLTVLTHFMEEIGPADLAH